jgi:hypothetical protein
MQDRFRVIEGNLARFERKFLRLLFRVSLPRSPRRALQGDPALHARPAPLEFRIRGEPVGHGVPMQQQAVEHQRQVDIGNLQNGL